MRIPGTRKAITIASFVLLLAFATLTPAQVVRQLTDFRTDRLGDVAIDDAGAVVFASSTADTSAVNAAHAFQTVRWVLPAAAAQVGSIPDGIGRSLSVTDDGLTVAIVAPSDPLGLNPDKSMELFLQSADGLSLAQLTAHGAGEGSVLASAISGSGNRIVFRANTDPLATNPDHVEQLFAVNSDGTGLIQLTSAVVGDGFSGFSISDDGQRVVFAHNGDLTGGNPGALFQIFHIEADGSNLLQLTTPGTDAAVLPVISGSGARIAYQIDGTIRTVLWDGSSDLLLAAGKRPSISDTGQWVYYEWYDGQNVEIMKAKAPSGAPIQLTFSTLSNFGPVVAGGNTRVTFKVSGGAYPGGNNPDLGVELMTMDSTGANILQLTNNGLERDNWEPDITPDGSRVAFLGGSFGVYDIHRIQTDGTDLEQVTTNAAGFHASLTADGNNIAFVSWSDLTGTSCTNGQIYNVQADGTGLMQLSPVPGCPPYDHPAAARDGSAVVYQSSARLFSVPGGGGGEFEFVNDSNSLRKNPRVSHDGVWTVFHSQSTGLNNPDGSTEVYRARTDGTLLEQITADPVYGSSWPDISANGNRIVYASGADPLGTNPENNAEIFLYDTGTGTSQQLTFTSTGNATQPRISGNGDHVYFVSTAGFFEDLPGTPNDLYRVTVATLAVERVSGLPDPRGEFQVASLRNNPYFAVDDSGGAVFSGSLDPTDQNADLSYELWRVDFDAVPGFDIGKTVPAALSWEPDPRAARYDVIRGDVANLQPGPGGSVDLGFVVCLENDSPDANTTGFEDLQQPVPGQTFFYVYRGSQGLLDGPGSWGTGLAGGERVAAIGACP